MPIRYQVLNKIYYQDIPSDDFSDYFPNIRFFFILSFLIFPFQMFVC